MLASGAQGLSAAWDWLTSLFVYNVTAKIGLVVALIGGIVAFRAFQTQARDSANAHMHGLFRDYLRLQFDYEDHAVGLPEALAQRRARKLTSFKLYVLEEMHAWVENERKKVRSPLFPPWSRKGRRDRSDALDAWVETIRSHVEEQWDLSRLMLAGDGGCYGLRFLEFVAAGDSADPAFVAWTRAPRRNLDARRPRFAGVVSPPAPPAAPSVDQRASRTVAADMAAAPGATSPRRRLLVAVAAAALAGLALGRKLRSGA